MGDGGDYGPTYNDEEDVSQGDPTSTENDDRAEDLDVDQEELERWKAELGIYESEDDGDEADEDDTDEDDAGAAGLGGGAGQESDTTAAAGGGAVGGGGGGPADADDGDVPPKPDEIPEGGYDHPEHYSDILHESDEVDVEALAEADTPQEFAEAVFHDGALAPRHQEGSGGVECLPVDEQDWDDRIGGWNDLDIDDTENGVIIRDSDLQSISGADSKMMWELPGYESDRVFVQYYEDPPEDKMTAAAWWKAHSQMGVYSFLDATGVRTPRFTADLDEGWVAVEEVGTKSGVDTVELKKLSDSAVAERVDGAEFRDQMAVNLLAQNWDLPPRNVRVGEDGSIHTFDFDYVTRSYTDMASVQRDASNATDSLAQINRHRSEPIQMSESDITDRAQEIAVAMRESGHEQRILNTVRQYDNAFPDDVVSREGALADRIQGTIDAAMPSG